MPDVMKTLLMNPPSFENFDGGSEFALARNARD